MGKHPPVGKSRASEGRDPSLLEDYAERRRDYAKGHALSAKTNTIRNVFAGRENVSP